MLSIKINISTLLAIVFIVLKLEHYIDWSWWWLIVPFILNIGNIEVNKNSNKEEKDSE